MKKYEIVLLINQDIPHQGVAVIAKKIDSLLGSDGKIISSEYWGLKDLAYKINNQKKARYYMLSVKMASNVVKIVSNYIKINEGILRSAIYMVENFDEKSQMLANVKNFSENVQDAEYVSIFPNSVTVKN